MKNLLYLLVFFLIAQHAVCQLNRQLCKPNEEIVFAFQLRNQKWVSLCREKNDDYIVYRFGTEKKLELEYPGKLDSTSWQQFTFKGYSRGGGKSNAAMWYGFLHFTTKNAEYEVYQHWDSEDDKEYCGITVTVNQKQIKMAGLLNTRKGHILSLDDSKIKIEEEQ